MELALKPRQNPYIYLHMIISYTKGATKMFQCIKGGEELLFTFSHFEWKCGEGKTNVCNIFSAHN